jgi:predicted RNA-binding Zn-ribbon protein involved in translation (DUF1610 family)
MEGYRKCKCKNERFLIKETEDGEIHSKCPVCGEVEVLRW